MNKTFIFCLFTIIPALTFAQVNLTKGVPAEVDFSVKLRNWDGFGFNYVETAQTMDYVTDPQD